jgi:formylglycine-generating enzyme required for sulfatase activity
MIVVPAGSFRMGDMDGGGYRDEKPVHRVTIPQPFAVGIYEVTFAQWDACVAGGGCGGYQPSDKGWGRGVRPVINVKWGDAKAYVSWLKRKTSLEYRLLSEAEWEYAARAGTTTKYHWGNSFDAGRANIGGKTVPVGRYEANRFGLHDMLGNVFEWVEDCWHYSYAGAPTDGRAWMSGNCTRHVLRGGSWYADPRYLRAAYRLRYDVVFRDNSNGFRVARTLFTP